MYQFGLLIPSFFHGFLLASNTNPLMFLGQIIPIDLKKAKSHNHLLIFKIFFEEILLTVQRERLNTLLGFESFIGSQTVWNRSKYKIFCFTVFYIRTEYRDLRVLIWTLWLTIFCMNTCKSPYSGQIWENKEHENFIYESFCIATL